MQKFPYPIASSLCEEQQTIHRKTVDFTLVKRDILIQER